MGTFLYLYNFTLTLLTMTTTCKFWVHQKNPKLELSSLLVAFAKQNLLPEIKNKIDKLRKKTPNEYHHLLLKATVGSVWHIRNDNESSFDVKCEVDVVSVPCENLERLFKNAGSHESDPDYYFIYVILSEFEKIFKPSGEEVVIDNSKCGYLFVKSDAMV